MDLNCPHYDKCSGCNQEKNLEHLNIFDEAHQFFIENGLKEFKLSFGAIHNWRCRAKLAVQGSFEAPLIGLFEEGSHRVVDIPFCRVHHPLINAVVERLRRWITENRIVPYEEKSGAGVLRYIQLTVDRVLQKVQIALVLNVDSFEALSEEGKRCIELLWNDNLEYCHSLWLNFNRRRDNVIFDFSWFHYVGERFVHERRACFHPASFMQANPEMFQQLTDRMGQMLPKNLDLLELYAGVGAIGLALVDHCRSVHCVEIVPEAKECFEVSCKALPLDLQERLSFESGDAGAQIGLLKSFSGTIVVDPPRKGLEPALLKALCGLLPAERLVYVSCGWKSFQRECKALLHSGWTLSFAEGFLFFPGSEHLEILAIFLR